MQDSTEAEATIVLLLFLHCTRLSGSLMGHADPLPVLCRTGNCALRPGKNLPLPLRSPVASSARHLPCSARLSPAQRSHPRGPHCQLSTYLLIYLRNYLAGG